MLTENHNKTYYCPFLKWAGGKTRLIPKHIRSLLPDIDNIKRYYEPFVGSGALFFYLANLPLSIKTSYLSDINEELINTYKCIQNQVDDVILLLKEHEKRHNESANIYKINMQKNYNSKHKNLYYYEIREENYDTDVQRAARFIYLNKTCFNGLYRVNSRGKFNVPLGRYENPKICQEDLLRDASKALFGAEIEQADFTEVLNHAKSVDDFVYFDPPYYPISKTSYFTAYSEHSFHEIKEREKDQEKLRDTCVELANRGVKVMVSNSYCEFIKDIYSELGFKIHTIQAARSINSNTENRGRISEYLITSY
jgi:DNA adenine methylase